MAARTILTLGEVANRCILSNVQCCKPKLYLHDTYKQTRGFKRLRNEIKNTEQIFQNASVDVVSAARPNVWKPLSFTILFSGTTIVAATIMEYEKIRAQSLMLINRYRNYRVHRTGWRQEMRSWWMSLTDGQRVFAYICFLNVLVTLAWRIPVLKNTMLQYFCANPASRALCWPMLLSTFSHHSFIHLALNMYVLHSFSSIAVASMGKEQFVAFYLSSGVVASFASHLYKVMLRIQGPSLGASGAVMGILGYVCVQYPDTRLSIVFLPVYTFTAGMAIKAIMGFDLAGCLLGWKFLDHAAHLGGALFGMFWHAWGSDNIWQKREPILSMWHELRGPPRSN